MSGEPARAIRCFVEGRVQGVGYRAATATRADELGISGWVRNRADGRVELVAAGPAAAIEALAAWLWRGPPAAAVEGVLVSEFEGRIEAGFRIAG